MNKGIKYFCLYCGAELDFEPTKDGGFCSTECEDNWYETGGIDLEAQATDAAERENHRQEVEGEIE